MNYRIIAGTYGFFEGIKVDTSLYKDPRHVTAHELAHSDLTMLTLHGFFSYFIHAIICDNENNPDIDFLEKLFIELVESCREVQEAYATANQLYAIRKYHDHEEEELFLSSLPIDYEKYLSLLKPIVDQDSDVLKKLFFLCSHSMNTNIFDKENIDLLFSHQYKLYFNIIENNPTLRFRRILSSIDITKNFTRSELNNLIEARNRKQYGNEILIDIANHLSSNLRDQVIKGLSLIKSDWINNYKLLERRQKIGIRIRYGRIDNDHIQKLKSIEFERISDNLKTVFFYIEKNHYVVIGLKNNNKCISTLYKDIKYIAKLNLSKDCAIACEMWNLPDSDIVYLIQFYNKPIFITIADPYMKTYRIWNQIANAGDFKIIGAFEQPDTERNSLLYSRIPEYKSIYCIPIDVV